jgi:ABC-type uncharacterized transport system substrate-binding protein
MFWVKRWLIVGLGIGLCGLLAGGCSSGDSSSAQIAPTDSPPSEQAIRILIVHSFGPEVQWVQQINAGITQELAEYGYSTEIGNLQLKSYYMNVQRAATEGELDRMGRGARAYIDRNTFDVIFAVDDEAILRVISLVDPSETPYVFVGLDSEPESYGLTDRENVAGVLERIHLNETLAWLLRVKPDADQITVLADSESQRTKFGYNVRLALNQSPFVRSSIHIVESFSEWQTVVEDAAGSDFLVIGPYQSLVDDEDSPVLQSDVIAWTLEHSVPPVVGFWEYTVANGALGGTVISAETQAEVAVEKAIRILNGESPREVGIDAPGRGKLMLNTTAIDRWKVTIPLDLIEVSALVE